MKTAPKWVQGPPAAETSDFRGPQMSDSFDSLPLDEDDECAICMGDPMSRSGQGVVSLQCSHRFHRDCVAALRNRKVAFPCTACDPDSPPPAWDDALRRYVRVRLLGQLAGRRPRAAIVGLALNFVRPLLALRRSSARSSRSAQAGTISTMISRRQ